MNEFRYVIFSPARGVHLDGDVWSNDPTAPTKGSAPTYPKDVKLDDIKAGVPDAELRFVVPLFPGDHASKKDCTDANLPGW